MKKEIKEIRKLMTEVENRLQALKAIPEPETRLWSVEKIITDRYYQIHSTLDKIKILEMIADYCNDRDEEDKIRYYPVYHTHLKKIDTASSTIFYLATPHFNSEETLQRLISENTEFFEQLLKPKE